MNRNILIKSAGFNFLNPLKIKHEVLPDPTDVFENPESYTKDVVKLLKIKKLKEQYNIDIAAARTSAGIQSAVWGALPAVVLGTAAGAGRGYVIDTLKRIGEKLKDTKAKEHIKTSVLTRFFGNTKIGQRIYKIYERHPAGLGLTVGIALPIGGAIVGSLISNPLRSQIFEKAHQTEIKELKQKYSNKLNKILND